MTEIRIITSNIRFDSLSDGEHNWDSRKEILSNVLLSHNPEIIGTQEGREPQLRDLENLLPNLNLIASHREWIEQRMYPCLFVNQNSISVKESGDFWLSETPDKAGSSSFESAFPRLCTWIKAEKENIPFLCANTHLDHVKDFTREHQIQVIIEELKKINKENLPLILMGDFNSGPYESTRKLLLENCPDLRDPWIDLNKEEESSHHPFTGSHLSGKRIDWILANKSFKALEIELLKDHQGKIYPSDHFPVKAVLEF